MDNQTVKVLFVDDESNVINSLSSLLFDLGPEYEFFFCKTASEAIRMLVDKEIEMIFTDLRMPEIDGVRLLDFVRQNYPKVIRVIFSEKSDLMMYQDAVQMAHQFLKKPFTIESLKKALSRKLVLQKYTQNESLISLVNGITELPTLPSIYIELESELAHPDVSMHRIGQIVSHDLSFTSKILQIVNSSFFGLSKRITDPLQAVNFLGRNVLKSLVLYHKLYSNFAVSRDVELYFEAMWMHSNKVGRFAEEIIYKTVSDVQMMEEAYISGLLHDIGKVALLSLPEYPEEVFRLMDEKNIRYSLAEYELFGVSHAEVGAYFLALWGLPESIIEAVYSHKKNENLQFDYFNVANAVYIANILGNIENFDLIKLKEMRMSGIPKEWLKYIEEIS